MSSLNEHPQHDAYDMNNTMTLPRSTLTFSGSQHGTFYPTYHSQYNTLNPMMNNTVNIPKKIASNDDIDADEDNESDVSDHGGIVAPM
jgi:hypothetical protein